MSIRQVVFILAAGGTAGCSGFAIEHGTRTRALDELGTSLGASKGSVGDRSGGGIAGEIFGQETILDEAGGLGMRAGLMFDTISGEQNNGAPAQASSYVGWYAMPIAYLGIRPGKLYARLGVGWIFSGDVKVTDSSVTAGERAESAMGIRGLVGLHAKVFDAGNFAYRFYLDGMATTTRDTSLGGYSGVALVGGFLVTVRP